MNLQVTLRGVGSGWALLFFSMERAGLKAANNTCELPGDVWAAPCSPTSHDVASADQTQGNIKLLIPWGKHRYQRSLSFKGFF